MNIIFSINKRTKRVVALFAIILLCVVSVACFVIVKISAPDNALKLGQTADTAEQRISLPILMYHSLLKNSNQKNDYVFSPDMLEKDLKYITENGYTAITPSDLVDYVYNSKPLPNKPIMLTFDDGHYNNYLYAFGLIKKYKCKVLISPIASVSEKFSHSGEISANYGYLLYDNMKEMVKSGYVEIGNHTYDMHEYGKRKGANKKLGESFETYKAILTEDITKAQEILKNNVNVTPVCFTYPFGTYSSNSEKVIKELGFKVSLICEEKTSIITKDKESLYKLGRYLRKNSETAEDFFKRINKC